MDKNFWTKAKQDLQRGYKDSFEHLKKFTGELTDEGKRKYKAFELKQKAHKQISELGGLAYELLATGSSVDSSAKVKAAMDKIVKIQEQIAKIEAEAPKKKPAKKKAAVKKKKAAKKAFGALICCLKKKSTRTATMRKVGTVRKKT